MLIGWYAYIHIKRCCFIYQKSHYIVSNPGSLAMATSTMETPDTTPLLTAPSLITENDRLRAMIRPFRAKSKSYSVTMKLAAVNFAEASNNSDAARKFNVDRRRIREWSQNKRKLEEITSDKTVSAAKRKRLTGGGRKALSETMEELLVAWIGEMRGERLRVTRKMVQTKAREFFTTNETVAAEAHDQTFDASTGWVHNFFCRHNITLRRRTTLGQSVPETVRPKLENFIVYVRAMRIVKDYHLNDIVAMDETAVWLDMPADNTVDMVGVKSVPLRTTGHEKNRITVCLAAKATGRKLVPMLVFKGTVI